MLTRKPRPRPSCSAQLCTRATHPAVGVQSAPLPPAPPASSSLRSTPPPAGAPELPASSLLPPPVACSRRDGDGFPPPSERRWPVGGTAFPAGPRAALSPLSPRRAHEPGARPPPQCRVYVMRSDASLREARGGGGGAAAAAAAAAASSASHPLAVQAASAARGPGIRTTTRRRSHAVALNEHDAKRRAAVAAPNLPERGARCGPRLTRCAPPRSSRAWLRAYCRFYQ